MHGLISGVVRIEREKCIYTPWKISYHTLKRSCHSIAILHQLQNFPRPPLPFPAVTIARIHLPLPCYFSRPRPLLSLRSPLQVSLFLSSSPLQLPVQASLVVLPLQDFPALDRNRRRRLSSPRSRHCSFVLMVVQLSQITMMKFRLQLIIRAFIFSPNERMNDLLLSWTRKGHAVGPRLLSYVSRLAYEAKLIGGLMNPTDAKTLGHKVRDGDSSNGDGRRKSWEHKSSKLTNLTKSLLKCHIDGYVSFLGSIGKDSVSGR